MGLYLLLGIGIIAFVIFTVSIFFMIGNRLSSKGDVRKEELAQLRKKVEELETRLEEK
ncbi:hypothetical protein [Pseudalkalibacillus salsuginis]|uniref:hypothetical protein n=1 Tax=Pseudalkalibacillus salsuginis TaxID=2910972 RepID=UPI001F41E999|nr:hypothetical protein [Pseudalkalibacillus salsuginis]MCF6411192.1 hypothetical protein [Pseudalkalibacillus salsuginis]